MAHIVKQNRKIEKRLIPKPEALELFAQKGQALKVQLIQEKVPGDVVQCYTMGDFIDFCLGPHLPSTKEIKAFKLKPEPSQSYWKGKEGNPAMQRIYGYAFFTKEELDAHLHNLEEARRRDHRKLGRELDLFSVADETGAGLILWHPKGGFIRKQIEDFWRDEHLSGGYDIVYSPHIANIKLWHTSGHTEYYKANMYSPIDIEGVEYQLKPMNCPFHITIYKSRLHSYRELPFRFAELGTVYRFERSGVLHGLMRVRGFTQDDAHLFCRPDQLEDGDRPRHRLRDLDAQRLRLQGVRRLRLHQAGEGVGQRRAVGDRHRGPEARARGARPEVHDRPRRGRLLRAQDRHQDQGLAGPRVAVLDHPGGLPQPQPLRARVHRRGRQAPPAGDDPPRAAREPRALLRRAHRALRGRVPALAGARRRRW